MVLPYRIVCNHYYLFKRIPILQQSFYHINYCIEMKLIVDSYRSFRHGKRNQINQVYRHRFYSRNKYGAFMLHLEMLHFWARFAWIKISHQIYSDKFELCSTDMHCFSLHFPPFLFSSNESPEFPRMSSDLSYIMLLFAHFIMIKWL